MNKVKADIFTPDTNEQYYALRYVLFNQPLNSNQHSIAFLLMLLSIEGIHRIFSVITKISLMFSVYF